MLPNADEILPNSDPLPPGTTNPVFIGNSTTLYEYKALYVGLKVTDYMEPLNQLGREGWHVVAEYKKHLLLERPITTSQAWPLAGPMDP